jgi:hypothetical protein
LQPEPLAPTGGSIGNPAGKEEFSMGYKRFYEFAAEYAPYDRLPAFHEGAENYRDKTERKCPHSYDSVEAQAWDRGIGAAMRFLSQHRRGA